MMRFVAASALAVFFTACQSGPANRASGEPAPSAEPAGEEVDARAIYDIEVKDIDGQTVKLSSLAGKAVLFVNTASECGLTPQYEGLQAIYEKYKDRGLVIAGFPCNQFGGQEPGTSSEIKTFCTSKYGVSFPMFEKLEVNGPGRHRLYDLLTKTPDASGEAGDVKWNFEKFLLSADGKRLQRFRPRVEPESDELIAAIEAALPS